MNQIQRTFWVIAMVLMMGVVNCAFLEIDSRKKDENIIEKQETPLIFDKEQDDPTEDKSVDPNVWNASYFKQMGVLYYEDTRYTWYSEKVLPGGGLYELNNNGRTVRDDGFIVDGDGYIAAASEDHPQGTILWSPFGYLKIYDCGCDYGTIDIYTSW